MGHEKSGPPMPSRNHWSRIVPTRDESDPERNWPNLGISVLPSNEVDDIESTAARLLELCQKKAKRAGKRRGARTLEISEAAFNWYTCALIFACIYTKQRFPISLLRLLHRRLGLVEGDCLIDAARTLKKPSEFVAAAKFEAKQPSDPDTRQPSTATLYGVAKAAGVDRHVIRKWRNEPTYRELIEWMRPKVSAPD